MSDLPSKPVNEPFLLHTDSSRHAKKVVGVEIEKLPDKPKDFGSICHCEMEGDVAHFVLSHHHDLQDFNETFSVYGKELPSLYDGERSSWCVWTEQRKMQLPSMTLIGEPYLWDPCPKCKSNITSPWGDLVKKGSVTYSHESCSLCGWGTSGNKNNNFVVRNVWGKEPKALFNEFDKSWYNNKYLAFYIRDRQWDYADFNRETPHHQFRILKWSELTQGKLSDIGAPIDLAKEHAFTREEVASYLVNRKGELCVLWKSGLLKLGASSVTPMMKYKEGEWKTIFEVKSTRNRYVVRGSDGKYSPNTNTINLIDSQGKVISSLDIQYEYVQDYQVGFSQINRSTFLSFSRTLTVVVASRGRLTLIAEKAKVWDDQGELGFRPIANGGKRLGFIQEGVRIASISLKYN